MSSINPSLKVMIIIDTAYIGGPGKGLLQMLKYQRSERYNFVICTFEYRKPKSIEFIDAVRSAGHELRLLPQRYRFDPAALFKAFDIVRTEHIDLVQSHGYKAHVVAFVISMRKRLPWLALTHGWTWENWKVRVYNQLERVLLKQADIAAAVSPPLLKELEKIRGAQLRSRLIPNAVDADEIQGHLGGHAVREEYDIPSDHVLLGVFGRLSPEKGVAEVLVAFHSVYSGVKNVTLLFVGNGKLATPLKSRVAELGLESQVKFAGYQSDMRDFYDAIDILVIPSLSEGLPNVLLEAMSLEVPAVCTRVGAIPDVIRHGETGWLVLPGDSHCLADQLREVILNPELRQKVASSARASLHPRFSPATRAKQFELIYDELLLGNSLAKDNPSE
ncbi:glycosyltransferase family 4 protein [Bythopirellula goksoeyrii]|uniref:Teichuronic acid biosynthesis glycosyltransferase TuaC n=1 Tax=Bythopirellula goksoeyrii TaxID=1400387 RepID=A0A5B9QE04_9BACT|nr:glycosyltransferase family 4 protein [Bythopirellula goksoeyrii]QEG36039.1 Putative teichuronic acid biosynthesis glycosyltransferase TuaC [Bythopirellula goksoeyrii]